MDDPTLTPFGRAQARASAERLARERIDAIYVSPYRRARETAAPLAEVTGLEPIVVDGLAEIGVAVRGLSQEDVDRYFVEGTRRPLDEHWQGWPGAESFRGFHARVTAALADVLGRHRWRAQKQHDFTTWDRSDAAAPNLVIVAHGGTNAVALTHLLDLDPVPWSGCVSRATSAFPVLRRARSGRPMVLRTSTGGSSRCRWSALTG